MARPKLVDDPAYRREGGGLGAALKKRLQTGRLSAADEELIRRTKIIRERRRQGWDWPKVAAECGEADWRKLSRFASKGMFRCIEVWLEAQEQGVSTAAAPRNADVAVPGVKENRGFLARLVPKALRRLEAALDQGMDGDGKVLVESKAADHAMDTVLEAAGLTEPEGAGRPAIVIETLVIQSLTQHITTDDAKIGRTIDVEAVPA